MASKDFYYPLSIGIAIGVALSSLVLFSYHQNGGCTSDNDKLYSIPDQPKRFAKAKETNNRRVLDIDAFYHPTSVAGKTVLVTGKPHNLPWISSPSLHSLLFFSQEGIEASDERLLMN